MRASVLIPPLQNVQAPQRFSLVPKPAPLASPLVDLVGRRKGALPFLLGLFGLKSTARLIVTHEEVNCETTTFTGKSVELIPLSSVADVHVAEFRPLPKLAFGVFLIPFGLSGYFYSDDAVQQMLGLLMCTIGVVLIAVYFLKRRLMLAVFSQSGIPIAIVLESGKIKSRLFGLADLVNIQRTIRMLVAGERPASAPDLPDVQLSELNGDEEDDDAVEEPDAHWQAPVIEEPPRASAVEAEQTARRLFDEARRRAKDGDRDGAVRLLRELVDAYPETTPAEQARKNLSKIGIKK
jgi:hypothetical protein